MTELSNEAKITATAFFMLPGFTSLSFNRPHIITPTIMSRVERCVIYIFGISIK